MNNTKPTTITLKEETSAKGNAFIVVQSGRRNNPWLTVDEAQAVLDNIPAVQAFVNGQKNKPKTVTAPAAATAPANVIDLQATVAAAVAAALKAAGVAVPTPTTTTTAPVPTAQAPASETPAPVVPAPTTPPAGKVNGKPTVRSRFASLK